MDIVQMAGLEQSDTGAGYTPEVFGLLVAEILKTYTREERAAFGQGFLSAFPHGISPF